MGVSDVNVVHIVSRVAHILARDDFGWWLVLLAGPVLSPAGADACFADRRAVWAKWVGIASALLLASGIFNFFVIHGEAKIDGGELPSKYHMFFGMKFLLALFSDVRVVDFSGSDGTGGPVP